MLPMFLHRTRTSTQLSSHIVAVSVSLLLLQFTGCQADDTYKTFMKSAAETKDRFLPNTTCTVEDIAKVQAFHLEVHSFNLKSPDRNNEEIWKKVNAKVKEQNITCSTSDIFDDYATLGPHADDVIKIVTKHMNLSPGDLPTSDGGAGKPDDDKDSKESGDSSEENAAADCAHIYFVTTALTLTAALLTKTA